MLEHRAIWAFSVVPTQTKEQHSNIGLGYFTHCICNCCGVLCQRAVQSAPRCILDIHPFRMCRCQWCDQVFVRFEAMVVAEETCSGVRVRVRDVRVRNQSRVSVRVRVIRQGCGSGGR